MKITNLLELEEDQTEMGIFTLDSCIMDKDCNYGAVVYLQNIASPVSVAQKAMEDIPHVILSGKGAEQFAYEKGFKKTNLLTEKSKKEWIEWNKKSQYKPIINIENHNTIGMLAVDNEIGAATATGVGEEVIRTVGSFLIAELMQQGKSPQEACEEVVKHIMAKK